MVLRRAKKKLLLIVLLSTISPLFAWTQTTGKSGAPRQAAITGFRNPGAELQLEQKFMAVPSPEGAQRHMRVLAEVPHLAGTEEDRKTADYVAQKFREAGLETRIDEYKVWFNYPKQIRVEQITADGPKLIGPSREHVEGDPYQDDPRIPMIYASGSPSGDVEAEVVYANYGRPEDFRKLQELGINLKGKIAVVRYGKNFRGVKSMVAQQYGLAGVIIYSDPMDDGYFRGDPYPNGPYRPQFSVQRGTVELTFEYPGDPTTPGIASVVTLPDSLRVPPQRAANLPTVPTTPLSYGDAWPILEQLKGLASPREWQGALPFTYHLGPGPIKVHLHLEQDYQLRSIWNVIGTVRGTESPDEWVIAGNHRDAWVFGASDPVSGTAAMLEAVRGIGELLKSGWRPRRTIVFASWDAEEQGLIGSTEFVEQYPRELRNAAAYFNTDIGVSGPAFGASAVPSLYNFIREIARAVPSPGGGTVYDAWKTSQGVVEGRAEPEIYDLSRPAAVGTGAETAIGDLGSGSDYTAFLQHAGVPSVDIGSAGPYGVYHSAFDDLAWFTKFADPTFAYEQQMARFFGLQVLRMSQADVLPYDYEAYAGQIRSSLELAKRKSVDNGWGRDQDFAPAMQAAARFAASAKAIKNASQQHGANPAALNRRLLAAEREFLLPEGLPHRPWFKHAIYAPGEYTGYQAVVLPGVNEAINRRDQCETEEQLQQLTRALERAADALATFH